MRLVKVGLSEEAVEGARKEAGSFHPPKSVGSLSELKEGFSAPESSEGGGFFGFSVTVHQLKEAEGLSNFL